MFCKNCGTEINSSDKFCYKCGFNLQEDKPNKTLTEQEIEKDFEKLDSKISAITNNSNNINSTEYLRKKSITLFLFLFPFTSLWGIHHFYNKRHLRGILYITLSLIFNRLTESTLIENNFFIAIIIVFLILYFFVTDLNWIIKLPKLYFVKNKYQRKTIILASFIPVF